MQINKKDLKPTTYHWYDLNFYLTDHLGNNRVVAYANGTVEQVTHYYPYGGLMGESTGGDTQPYKYNGKELDRTNGLDWYDYGARHMDGARFILRTLRQPLLDILCDQRNAGSCHNFPKHYTNPLTR